ncbi:hypothetical protein ClosIBUN13A_CONTIG146g02241 [Clostridium sp. IBUN13A]|nr:ATP-dependent helicase [Clostridium butyricum]KJZ84424.1 ATP-dependent DNA helicase UvrD/PcrA [Clostridium sp. IBUN125C]KJZ94318.1 hypothetical protein ClosIBUN62F_CONTIG3g00153 [Clostridium sp. IBUN62F]KJZ96786.1 ATP-dependent DNA helicase UvrD/PcrA [Clostridium sp. IBUN22A]KJZ96854.1 hypothetical protein ClosIBUN13A_CONTIG146g02241 [Clostridium sp. IBUN13A]
MFLNKLNEKQRDVCLSDENIILTACPGSGKTRTLTYRIAYLCLKNRPSRRLNIAITYTNRAADEIKKRLQKVDDSIENAWAGTIHQFCLEYIIKPYSMYFSRLSHGFHIIDEYVQREYENEIVEELGIRNEIGFNDPLNYKEVKEKYIKKLYDNKEIDFNDILDISYELLNKNKFIRENIANIIRSIHVDEYQDTNDLQYKILGEIVHENKSINILFVGDLDQAIYSGIGGIAKDKIEIEKEFEVKFIEKKLDGCYRSSQRVINYYKKFQQNEQEIFSFAENKDTDGIIYVNKSIHKSELISRIAYIVKKQLKEGTKENEICIIAPQWYLLYPLSKELRKLLPDVNFDAPDITPIKYDPLSLFYNISVLFFTKAGRDVFIRKRCASTVMNILSDEYRIDISRYIDNLLLLKYINSFTSNSSNGIEYLKEGIEYLFFHLHIDINKELALKKSYNDFFDRIDNRIERYNLSCNIKDIAKSFMVKKGVVINTFHGVKGEEYKTVIAFGLLHGYIPHWNIIFNTSRDNCEKETKKLLYVICSRAKENIFLFAEKGRITQRGIEYEMTHELQEYKYNYDKIY